MPQVISEDMRRAEPCFFAQPTGYRKERRSFARQVSDGTVRAAIADGRPVALVRPIHEHRNITIALQAGKQPRRGIALDGGAARLAPTLAFEKGLDLAE